MYLWTERHFERVMRYLIESEWTDGIKIMLKSLVTHAMVKAFNGNERCFFVENMIGDIFSMKNSEV